MKIKISHKILLAILAVTIMSVLIISFGTTQIMKVSLQDEITDKLTLKSIEQMDRLGLFIHAREIDLREFTTEKSFEDGTLDEKIERLEEIKSISTFYEHIDLYSPTGVKIADSDGFKRDINIPNDPDVIHDKFHENNADQVPLLHTPFHGGVYSDPRPFLDPEHERGVLRFSGPIYDGDDNLEGILVASVPIETLNDIIENEITDHRINANVDIDLIGREGTLIFSNYINQDDILNKDLKHLSIYEEIRKSPRNVEYVISSEEGEEQIYVAVEEEKFGQSRSKGWIMISKMSTEEAFAPIDRAVESGINAAIIMITISIPLALLITYPITRDLNDIIETIEEISKGKTKIEIKKDLKEGNDEMARLARALDRIIKNKKS